MLTSFWESVGEGLSEKWLERLFGPAFLFWAGGLLLWIGPGNLSDRWAELIALPPVAQSGLLIATLLTLAGSARLMAALSIPILRFLEGYWPWPLDYVGTAGVALRRKIVARRKRRWSDLMLKRQKETLSWREQRELARLETWRGHTPRDEQDLLPTHLGNILRAAETRPRQRYGLDAVLLWPRLWLLLPENVRQDLSAARGRMDDLAGAWGWGLLFLGWTFTWHWAWVIALLWMGVVYALLVQSAQAFADLLVATFDTQRWRLYEALRWPLPPKSGAAEIAAGEALTRYVQRGMQEEIVQYRHTEGS